VKVRVCENASSWETQSGGEVVATSRGGDALWLFGLCAARVGSSMPFQAYAGVLPLLQTEWAMSGTMAGTVALFWQGAYAISLVVLSALADRVGARRLFFWSGWATALTMAIAPLLAAGYYSGLVMLSVVALVNGGTYTPGLMLLASRFPSARRGHAIGWFLASSSLGYTLALVMTSGLVGQIGWRGTWLVIAGFAGATTLLAAGVLGRDSPALSAAPPSVPPVSLVEGFLKNRAAMLIMAGYTFHSWEVLGMWGWTPAFLAAALTLGGWERVGATGLGAGLSASFHLMGLLASFSGGWLSDRWGRTAVILAMLTLSGACSFGFGWMIALPLAVIAAVGIVYAFSAIGDSPVFSTGFTELVDPRILGASFALRSLAGFGAGAIASWVFGRVLDLANPGAAPGQEMVWGWSFATLGLGAVLGIVSTVWLRALPESRRMAEGRR
jgi:MFS family permease